MTGGSSTGRRAAAGSREEALFLKPDKTDGFKMEANASIPLGRCVDDVALCDDVNDVVLCANDVLPSALLSATTGS
jgi:hypothetical protein